MSPSDSIDLGEDRSLLLVDDDEPFLRRLARAMEKRGFEVETAGSVVAGRAIATARPPAYAVVDLRLEDGNGLDVVEVLREKRPDSRIVVLTGYGQSPPLLQPLKLVRQIIWQNLPMRQISRTPLLRMVTTYHRHLKIQ